MSNNLDLFDKVISTAQPVGFPEIVLFAIVIWLGSYFLSVYLLLAISVLIAYIRKTVWTIRSVIVAVVLGFFVSIAVTIAAIEDMSNGRRLSEDDKTKVLMDPVIQGYWNECRELDSRQSVILEKTRNRVLELTGDVK